MLIDFIALKIYDVLGSEVAILINEEKSAGTYELEFNAKVLPREFISIDFKRVTLLKRRRWSFFDKPSVDKY